MGDNNTHNTKTNDDSGSHGSQSNNNNNVTTTTAASWDDVCVLNPHEGYLAEGRTQGRAAGLAAGYQDGWQLGQTTALEYGMEIGFIRGVLDALEKDHTAADTEEPSTSGRPLLWSTKAAKTLADVKRLIQAFPDATTIFQSQHHHHQQQKEENEESTPANAVEANDDTRWYDNDSETNATNEDDNVRQLLQKIRTRFRLLMVQLKMPNISLTQAMNTEISSDSVSKNNPPVSADW